MNTALEAIRAELAGLRPRVGLLEQAEALLAPAYEPAKHAEPGEPPRPPREPDGRADRRPPSRPSGTPTVVNPSRGEIREYVCAKGPVSRGEVLAALGGSAYAMNSKLKALLAAGQIAATGKPKALRYHACEGSERAKRGPAALRRQGARVANGIHPDAPPRGVYRVYDAIADSGGATTDRLMDATGLSEDAVIHEGRHLRRLGLVRYGRQGSERKWSPVLEREARHG